MHVNIVRKITALIIFNIIIFGFSSCSVVTDDGKYTYQACRDITRKAYSPVRKDRYGDVITDFDSMDNYRMNLEGCETRSEYERRKDSN